MTDVLAGVANPPPPPPQRSKDDVEQRRRSRIELLAAILIGTAAIFTALATYLGDGVDGSITATQNESLRLDLIANDIYNDANAQRAIERDWIFSWITESQNDSPAAAYLEVAMPHEVLALAVEWNDADDDVADPFSEAAFNSYESHGGLLSTQLEVEALLLLERAECLAFEGQVLEIQGENFGVSQVFLATTLVVGGIAALLRRRLAQYIVLVTAVLSLLSGLLVLSLGTDEADARATVAADFFSFDEQNMSTVSPERAVQEANQQCPQ